MSYLLYDEEQTPSALTTADGTGENLMLQPPAPSVQYTRSYDGWISPIKSTSVTKSTNKHLQHWESGHVDCVIQHKVDGPVNDKLSIMQVFLLGFFLRAYAVLDMLYCMVSTEDIVSDTKTSNFV